MSDLQKGFTFTTGAPDNEVTAAKLNQLVDNGTILAGFYSGKPVKTATDSADKFLILDSISGEFRQITATNAIPAAITPDPHLFWNGNTNVTVSNSTTETSMLSAGSGSLTIAAGYLTAGSMVRFVAAGSHNRRFVGPNDSIYWRLKFGSTVVSSINRAAGGQNNAQITNGGFRLEAYLTIRTAGASGGLVSNVVVVYSSVGDGATASDITVSDSVITPVTINTTVTNTIDLTAQWSVASANNSVTVSQSSLLISRIS